MALDQQALEAAHEADIRCQREHCKVASCNGFLCHAAITAYLAALGDGWQPIETAPNDRKVLVAYRNQLGNWRIVTARYYTDLAWDLCYPEPDDGEFAPEGWYEESDSADVLCLTSCPPTHWCPLPTPPGEKK